MGKIPDELRETIARNIRECRIAKFPGRGGGKACAEAFHVSPQQWSPWERGMRTPDELRLQQIAEFFGVTVEYLRKDHRSPSPAAPEMPSGAKMADSGEYQSHSPTSSSQSAKIDRYCPPCCCPLIRENCWTVLDNRRLLWLMEKYIATAGGSGTGHCMAAQ